MAVASANRTVVGVFKSMDDAQRAFDALQSEGFSRDEISFVANKNAQHSWGNDDARTDDGETASNVAADAGIGAALGGVGGLLLSFAGLAIPGIGPILAAGPIIAALGGAGIGAAAGGLIGGLTEHGVPEEHARHYAEGVRRGDILITVRTDGDRADRAAAIMDDNGAVDIDHRVAEWKSRGYERHDTAGEPMTSDELRREREYSDAARQQGDEWRDETRRNSDISSGVLGLGPTSGPSGAMGSTVDVPATGGDIGTAPGGVGPDRSRERDLRNTGLSSGSAGAGHNDLSAGTAGVTTGTGPGRMVGTEAGLGTGPNSTQDFGQHRGTTPSASRAEGGSLTGSEASNARRDAQRTSDYAEDTIGSRRTDLPSTQDNLRRSSESGVERIEDDTENAMHRAGDKLREAGRDTKRGASRIYNRLT